MTDRSRHDLERIALDQRTRDRAFDRARELRAAEAGRLLALARGHARAAFSALAAAFDRHAGVTGRG